jgi:hypothetical protein
VDARQKDLGGGPALGETFDEIRDPARDQVVPEVHHERVLAEEAFRGEDRVRQPERLRLVDVRDL